MVRKQIYIEPRQEEMLKRLARELGVAEAELIRQGIDQVARGRQVVPRDEHAWEEEKAFIAKRRRLNVPQTGRAWTRGELYDERLRGISS
jgi:transposase-like protein